MKIASWRAILKIIELKIYCPLSVWRWLISLGLKMNIQSVEVAICTTVINSLALRYWIPRHWWLVIKWNKLRNLISYYVNKICTYFTHQRLHVGEYVEGLGVIDLVVWKVKNADVITLWQVHDVFHCLQFVMRDLKGGQHWKASWNRYNKDVCSEWTVHATT